MIKEEFYPDGSLQSIRVVDDGDEAELRRSATGRRPLAKRSGIIETRRELREVVDGEISLALAGQMLPEMFPEMTPYGHGRPAPSTPRVDASGVPPELQHLVEVEHRES